MKIKLLKSGKWCLGGTGKIVDFKEGEIHDIDSNHAIELINSNWASENLKAKVSVKAKIKTDEL